MLSVDHVNNNGSYPIPGLLILINIVHFVGGKHRRGAEKDRDEALEAFESVGFEVLELQAENKNKLVNDFKSIANSDLVKTFSIFGVAISTHGEEQGFNCSNMDVVEVELLYSIFNNKNCPKLANKPKLFFFNFCRGDNAVTSLRLEADLTLVLPPTSDMFTVFSTLQQTESLRHPECGSLFWKALKNVLTGNQSRENREIYKLMIQLNQELLAISQSFWKNSVNKPLQVIEFRASGWMKELFLLKQNQSYVQLLKMLPMHHFCRLDSEKSIQNFETIHKTTIENYLKSFLPMLLKRMNSWKLGPFFPTDADSECLEKQILSQPFNYSIFNMQKMESENTKIKYQMLLMKMNKASEINILMLGQTGVGKSTLINSIANYLTYQTFEEAEINELILLTPIKFTVSDDNFEIKQVTCSGLKNNQDFNNDSTSTQNCKCYNIPFRNHLIRIIDTPAIGDVRGIEQDKKNIDDIITFINKYHEIHAICILMKPSTRFTDEFQVYMKNLFSQLSKSYSKNYFFVFTHARNNFYKTSNSLSLLKKILDDITSETLIPQNFLKKETVFSFDNEAFRFLVAKHNGIKFTTEQILDFSISWHNSFKETMRLINQIIDNE